MLGRVVAGTIASVALLCATIAWAGWVYLHTVGDPHRTEEIATAVLDDDAARAEIAAVLATQIVERTGVPPDVQPTVATAVDAALADDRVAANLIDAFGSEHARALGVDDPRPTVVDTDALLAAVREHLAIAAPSIATMLDSVAAAGQVPDLTLPDLHTDAAGRVRRVADQTTTTLGIAAVALLGLAFAVGDRRHIMRRLGTWAIFSGIGWLAGPHLVALISKRFTSDLDATIDAVRAALQGPVIVGSIVLVGVGVAALVAWMLPIWPSAAVDGGQAYQPTRAWAPRTVYRREVVVAEPSYSAAAAARTASMPATATYTTSTTPTAGPVDTFQWSGQHPGQHATQQWTQQTGQHPGPPAGSAWGEHAGATSSGSSGPATDPWAATVPTAEDVDPWSLYFDRDDRNGR